MDGQGRLSRSLKAWLPSRADAAEVAGEAARALGDTAVAARKAGKQARRKAVKLRDAVLGEPVYIPRLVTDDGDGTNAFFTRIERYLPPRGVPFALALAVILGSGAFGLHVGGGYQRAVTLLGTPQDIAARAIVLVSPKCPSPVRSGSPNRKWLIPPALPMCNRWPFLMPRRLQETLTQNPLIAEAEVRKLFPNRLTIRIRERTPYALWQKDGEVHLISADGALIDQMRDSRFRRAAACGGRGANRRAGDYVALLDAAGDLREKIRAGVLVSGRRWNLKLANASR